GDYQGAYERLSPLIESAAGGSSDMLFFCRKLRGRVAFLWVEDCLNKTYPVAKETLSLLEQASEDLNWCSRYLDRHRFTQDQGPKVYRVSHDRARAMVTRTEVELELKLLPEADRHLHASKRLITGLGELAEYYKLKVPQPTQLNERREACSKRLKSLQLAGGPNPRSSSSPAPPGDANSGLSLGSLESR